MNKKINTKKINSSTAIVDKAFHMPISESEKLAFDKIKEQVYNDNYLPLGYRALSCASPVLVANIEAFAQNETDSEAMERTLPPRWDAKKVMLLARHYEKMDTAELANMLEFAVSTVYAKARKLGLHKDKKTSDAQRIQKIKEAFAERRLKKINQNN